MKIIDRLKNFLNESKETVKISEINELFRGRHEEQVDDLAEVTYFVCIKTLSESVSKLPIYLLDGEKQRVVKHETNKIMQIKTNDWQTPSQFLLLLEFNRNHRGNGYAYISRKNDGTLEKLIPLDSRSVQIWINNTDRYTHRNYFYMYCDNKSGKTYWLNPEDVLHVRSWLTDDNGLIGRSVREVLWRQLSGAKASSKFLSELYEKGLIANACVKYVGDLKKESQNKLLERIETQARERNRKMFTLPVGFDIVPLDMKLTDSQFMELKQFSALQIASAFGINPTFLNDYNKASYANSEMQQMTFYVNTLLPIIVQYEQELNRKLLSTYELEAGLHFKFNINVLLRPDSSSQAEIIQKMVQSGVYSANEARHWLDMPSVGEKGDKLLVNGSMVEMDKAGVAYERNNDTR